MKLRPLSLRIALSTPIMTAATLGLIGVVFWMDLSAPLRQTAGGLLPAERAWLLGLLALPSWLAWIVQRYLNAERERLSLNHAIEVIQGMSHGQSAHRVRSEIVPSHWSALVSAINELGQESSRLRGNIQQLLDDARAAAAAENARLGGLLANLEQAVVVFRADGCVVLYNRACARLFAESDPPIGLGRSIYAYFDRRLIDHSLHSVAERSGSQGDSAVPLLTTSRDGRRMRLRLAGLAGAVDPDKAEAFVLVIHDVTRQLQDDATSLGMFQSLLELARSRLATLEVASRTGSPDDMPSLIQSETARLLGKFDELNDDVRKRLHRNWPLERIRGADLRQIACRQIAKDTGLRTLDDGGAGDQWLTIDSFSLLQTIGNLAARLQEAFSIDTLRIRLQEHDQGAVLDLVWLGVPMSAETAFSWQSDAFTLGGNEGALTLAQVMERHGGHAWYERHAPTQANLFRLKLLAADGQGDTDSPSRRLTHYDFSLLEAPRVPERLDQLTFTALDTETTGLEPNHGDEVIWLSAVRVVNGRVLSDDTFDTLVDPQRPIPASATRIHGVRDRDVCGQPFLVQVLPRFRQFVADSVLLGHNVDFDLRFFALKSAGCGVRFDQPCLDTLKLAELVFPSEPSNTLEELASRLGLPAGRRHHASDDALLTARVLVAMLPLLAARGIVTLPQALAASAHTRYAHLSYT